MHGVDLMNGTMKGEDFDVRISEDIIHDLVVDFRSTSTI